MTVDYSSWTHGSAVAVERFPSLAVAHDYGTLYTPPNDSDTGRWDWFHFAVPTPVIVNKSRLSLVSAVVRLEAGPGVRITGFLVNDGQIRIAEHMNLSKFISQPDDLRFDIPGGRSVGWGISISVAVEFAVDGGENNWVKFYAAGIDLNNGD